jgi:hypothetical protein
VADEPIIAITKTTPAAIMNIIANLLKEILSKLIQVKMCIIV